MAFNWRNYRLVQNETQENLSLLTGRWVLRAACACGVSKRHRVESTTNCASTSRRTHTMTFRCSSVLSFCTPFSEADVMSRGKRRGWCHWLDSHVRMYMFKFAHIRRTIWWQRWHCVFLFVGPKNWYWIRMYIFQIL